MNTKQAAQVIRDSVTMDQILSLYGYRTRHGFMCCPFHGEKAPSLKVYPETGGWHCFGCGRGGSVIDFVMEHENCGFRTAVGAIDKALHLGLTDPHEDPEEARQKQRIQLALDNFAKAVTEDCERYIRMVEAEQAWKVSRFKDIRDKETQEITAKEWDILHQWKAEDEYDEERKAKAETLMKEVAEWRRRARRAG